MGWVWRARMPGDTVFRRFAALPRAIVAHLIAAEPLYQPDTIPQAGGSKFGSCKTLTMPCFEVSLVFWTGVFLSPGRRIRVIGKETGPGPGGYG